MKAKYFAPLFLLLSFALSTAAQIKVDSNYTILARGIEGTNILGFIYADFNCIVIKENATGKTCTPVSAQYTFLIGSETFHAGNAKDAQRYMNRSKPKDKIFIDHIVLASGCFTPPKQIVITVM